MALNDLLGSVKRKVGAGVLGLGLVLGSYGGMGCGEEEKEWTCESGDQMMREVCYPYFSSEEKEEVDTHFLKGCREGEAKGLYVQEYINCVYKLCKETRLVDEIDSLCWGDCFHRNICP